VKQPARRRRCVVGASSPRQASGRRAAQQSGPPYRLSARYGTDHSSLGSPVRVLRHRLPGREVSWSGGTPVAFIVVRSVRELIRPAAASSRVRYAW